MAEALLVEPDVGSAQNLTAALDAQGKAPKAVLWVYSHDTDRWRLWIVPKDPVEDRRAFYTELSILIESEPDRLGSLDIGVVNIVNEDSPAIKGLRKLVRADGIMALRFKDNVFNGVYLPDAIIIRLAS